MVRTTKTLLALNSRSPSRRRLTIGSSTDISTRTIKLSSTAMDDPDHHQLAQAVGRPAQSGRPREHRGSRQQRPFGADPARRRDEHGQAHQEPDDDPVDRRSRGVEVPADGRDGHIDDGDVQDAEEQDGHIDSAKRWSIREVEGLDPVGAGVVGIGNSHGAGREAVRERVYRDRS